MAAIPNSIGIPALALKKMTMLSYFRSINNKSIELNKDKALYIVIAAKVQISSPPFGYLIKTSKVSKVTSIQITIIIKSQMQQMASAQF